MRQEPSTVQRLNELLANLHGPTECVGSRMNQLVPFPTNIGSLEDANVLDLCVSVDRCTDDLGTTATVETQVRYSTRRSMVDVYGFYLNEFHRAGVRDEVTIDDEDSQLVLIAILAHGDLGRCEYRVIVTDFGRTRSVKATVRYDGFDYRDTFARFAQWHDGAAPIPQVGPEATAIQIATFQQGRAAGTVVLYETQYGCDATPQSDMRMLVDARLSELDWPYHERQTDVLFLQGGPFAAEAHVFSAGCGSGVKFVGEFHFS